MNAHVDGMPQGVEPVAWRARSYSWPTWAYGDTESSACDRACRNNEEVVADVQALYTHPTPVASDGGLREALDDALQLLSSLPDDVVMPDHPIFGRVRRALSENQP